MLCPLQPCRLLVVEHRRRGVWLLQGVSVSLVVLMRRPDDVRADTLEFTIHRPIQSRYLRLSSCCAGAITRIIQTWIIYEVRMSKMIMWDHYMLFLSVRMFLLLVIESLVAVIWVRHKRGLGSRNLVSWLLASSATAFNWLRTAETSTIKVSSQDSVELISNGFLIKMFLV